ncbi:BSD domain-containing protein [Actinidia rufa]|uniref:BSD domain-containing protein n=1 Tax=Actinidia rufa TaxID=165716 RepID=A0A7J0EJK7_9ERIC|nr:BSD domain-containing protein [Actinidia rufa]
MTTLMYHMRKSDSVPFNAQSESLSLEAPAIKPVTSLGDADFEIEKHPVQSTEIPIIDKSVIEEGPEENSEIISTGGTTIPIENEEDVSFRDLEEDDGDVPTSYKKVSSHTPDMKESNDWLDIDEIDVE